MASGSVSVRRLLPGGHACRNLQRWSPSVDPGGLRKRIGLGESLKLGEIQRIPELLGPGHVERCANLTKEFFDAICSCPLRFFLDSLEKRGGCIPLARFEPCDGFIERRFQFRLHLLPCSLVSLLLNPLQQVSGLLHVGCVGCRNRPLRTVFGLLYQAALVESLGLLRQRLHGLICPLLGRRSASENE